jgi:hypothetical protein
LLGSRGGIISVLLNLPWPCTRRHNKPALGPVGDNLDDFQAALHGPVVDGHGPLALGRRLRPSARKLDQDLFLVFGFGLADPTHRFLGILPELISL